MKMLSFVSDSHVSSELFYMKVLYTWATLFGSSTHTQLLPYD